MKIGVLKSFACFSACANRCWNRQLNWTSAKTIWLYILYKWCMWFQTGTRACICTFCMFLFAMHNASRYLGSQCLKLLSSCLICSERMYSGWDKMNTSTLSERQTTTIRIHTLVIWFPVPLFLYWALSRITFFPRWVVGNKLAYGLSKLTSVLTL